MHAALFSIDSGKCIDGPCPGDFLERVNVSVKDGKIHLVR